MAKCLNYSTKNYLSSVKCFSSSEGDCELNEFGDIAAVGGVVVPSKTTRRQCEDHCLFYVSYHCISCNWSNFTQMHRHINHLVRNTPNHYFTAQKITPRKMLTQLDVSSQEQYYPIYSESQSQSKKLRITNNWFHSLKLIFTVSRPVGATIGRKDQRAAWSTRNQRTISVTDKAEPFMSKSEKRARKVSKSIFEFFLNVFTEFAEFSDKNMSFSKRTRTPANQPPLV